MSKKTLSPEGDEPDNRRSSSSVNANEEFGPQSTPTHELPSPRAFALNVTHRALEVIYGSRDIGQLARWVSEDVYHSMERHVNAELRRRSHLPPAARTRQAPLFTLGKAHLFSPRDGVMEVCVLVKTRNRFQTAALRIEGWDHRWRATAFAFL